MNFVLAQEQLGNAVVRIPRRVISLYRIPEVIFDINRVPPRRLPGQYGPATILEMGGKDAIIVDATLTSTPPLKVWLRLHSAFRDKSAPARGHCRRRIYDIFLES